MRKRLSTPVTKNRNDKNTLLLKSEHLNSTELTENTAIIGFNHSTV